LTDMKDHAATLETAEFGLPPDIMYGEPPPQPSAVQSLQDPTSLAHMQVKPQQQQWQAFQHTDQKLHSQQAQVQQQQKQPKSQSRPRPEPQQPQQTQQRPSQHPLQHSQVQPAPQQQKRIKQPTQQKQPNQQQSENQFPEQLQLRQHPPQQHAKARPLGEQEQHVGQEALLPQLPPPQAPPPPPASIPSQGGKTAKTKFFKTKMCEFNRVGRCKKRASCNFAHGEHELARNIAAAAEYAEAGRGLPCGDTADPLDDALLCSTPRDDLVGRGGLGAGRPMAPPPPLDLGRSSSPSEDAPTPLLMSPMQLNLPGYGLGLQPPQSPQLQHHPLQQPAPLASPMGDSNFRVPPSPQMLPILPHWYQSLPWSEFSTVATCDEAGLAGCPQLDTGETFERTPSGSTDTTEAAKPMWAHPTFPLQATDLSAAETLVSPGSPMLIQLDPPMDLPLEAASPGTSPRPQRRGWQRPPLGSPPASLPRSLPGSPPGSPLGAPCALPALGTAAAGAAVAAARSRGAAPEAASRAAPADAMEDSDDDINEDYKGMAGGLARSVSMCVKNTFVDVQVPTSPKVRSLPRVRSATF